MSQQDILQTYRQKALALRVLQEQYARCDRSSDGGKLAEGLEVMMERHRKDLDALWPQVLAMLNNMDDPRMYLVIHAYYVLGQSLDDIAQQLYVSYRTVSRWKKGFLDQLNG